MPLEGRMGGLIGMVDVLRIEWLTCGRHGRYHTARLVAELGSQCQADRVLHEHTLDCLRKNHKV